MEKRVMKDMIRRKTVFRYFIGNFPFQRKDPGNFLLYNIAKIHDLDNGFTVIPCAKIPYTGWVYNRPMEVCTAETVPIRPGCIPVLGGAALTGQAP